MLPTTYAMALTSEASEGGNRSRWTDRTWRKKMRAQRVQEFLTLNGFAVAIDADLAGNRERVRDFQTARGLPASASST